MFQTKEITIKKPDFHKKESLKSNYRLVLEDYKKARDRLVDYNGIYSKRLRFLQRLERRMPESYRETLSNIIRNAYSGQRAIKDKMEIGRKELEGLLAILPSQENLGSLRQDQTEVIDWGLALRQLHISKEIEHYTTPVIEQLISLASQIKNGKYKSRISRQAEGLEIGRRKVLTKLDNVYTYLDELINGKVRKYIEKN